MPSYRTLIGCVKWGQLCSSYFSSSITETAGYLITLNLISVALVIAKNSINTSLWTGCVLSHTSVSHVFYAEGIYIMSDSPASLQQLINICYS